MILSAEPNSSTRSIVLFVELALSDATRTSKLDRLSMSAVRNQTLFVSEPLSNIVHSGEKFVLDVLPSTGRTSSEGPVRAGLIDSEGLVT